MGESVRFALGPPQEGTQFNLIPVKVNDLEQVQFQTATRQYASPYGPPKKVCNSILFLLNSFI